MLGQVARSVVARTSRLGARRYHGPAEYKTPTMDEVPVPQGCWKQQYESNQKKYNLHLLAGIVIFAGSWGIILGKELVFFNAFAPKSPPKN